MKSNFKGDRRLMPPGLRERLAYAKSGSAKIRVMPMSTQQSRRAALPKESR
jgi:hypothetical protein